VPNLPVKEYLKFGWIGLCFLVALVSRLRCAERRDWAFLAAGLGFTFMSDYFLILYNRQHIGIFLFCFAHAAYIMRTGSVKVIWLLFVPAVILAGVLSGNFLPAVTFNYAVLFIIDIFAHVRFYRNNTRLPKINRILALTGILLFFGCDFNLVLYNLHHFIPGTEPVKDIGYILLWVFYLPAQAVLAVSALDLRFLRRG
jgi:hypothetical protein